MAVFTDNESWLAALKGDAQSQVLDELRRSLLRGLRYSLMSRYHVTEVDLEDFVQDALLKILDGLDSFRGESRFTTWAQKIAIRTALTELRRRRWNDVSLQDLLVNDQGEDYTPAFLATPRPTPEQYATQKSFFDLVMQLINESLTSRQRQAVRAVMFAGMPLEEIARRMGTNRNAMYKLIHDARMRLKAGLVEQGVTLSDVLSAFADST
jgi:RNA polymerase sigma factor (sigma-70 family)